MRSEKGFLTGCYCLPLLFLQLARVEDLVTNSIADNFDRMARELSLETTFDPEQALASRSVRHSSNNAVQSFKSPAPRASRTSPEPVRRVTFKPPAGEWKQGMINGYARMFVRVATTGAQAQFS